MQSSAPSKSIHYTASNGKPYVISQMGHGRHCANEVVNGITTSRGVLFRGLRHAVNAIEAHSTQPDAILNYEGSTPFTIRRPRVSTVRALIGGAA